MKELKENKDKEIYPYQHRISIGILAAEYYPVHNAKCCAKCQYYADGTVYEGTCTIRPKIFVATTDVCQLFRGYDAK